MLDMINYAKPEEMSDILLSVQRRYHELFPDWELHIIILEKSVDKGEQLNRMIALLEAMKNR